jgi:hypothetical protein
MIGVIIFLIVLVVVIPVGFLMSMAVPAAVIGFVLKRGSETDNAGSELIDTNY